MFLYMDPPEHDRLRTLVSRVFTPRAVNQLEPMVRRVIAAFADEIGDADTFDLVQQWSGPFPVEVFSEMLGIPPGDRQQIRYWLDVILQRYVGSVHPSPGAEAAQIESGMCMWNLVQERRHHPTDDMISQLIGAEVDRGHGVTTRLDDEEITGFLSLLAGAGAETVTKLVANAAVLFARNPDQWRLVRDDPGLVADQHRMEDVAGHPPMHLRRQRLVDLACQPDDVCARAQGDPVEIHPDLASGQALTAHGRRHAPSVVSAHPKRNRMAEASQRVTGPIGSSAGRASTSAHAASTCSVVGKSTMVPDQWVATKQSIS